MTYTAVDALATERAVFMIPLHQLEPHPGNPRRDVGDISDLTADVAARGVDSPLTVVPTGEEALTPDGEYLIYRVVIGHRRRAAAIAAGLDRVPCIIRTDLTPGQQRQMMVRENVHRADLTPVEEADAYQAMLDLDGLTVEQVAAAVSRSESTVRRRLPLATAPEKAREAIQTRAATLEDWSKALFSAGDDPQALEVLAAALGTRDFDWKLRDVERTRRNATADAAARAWIEQAGIPTIERDDLNRDTHRHMGFVDGHALADGKPPRIAAEGVPEGSVAVRYFTDGGWELWRPYTAEEVARAEQRTAALVDAAPRWAEQAAESEAAREKAKAEAETAAELRQAFLAGFASKPAVSNAATATVARGVAEILALCALADIWIVESETLIGRSGLALHEYLDDARDAAQQAGEDPDDVDQAEVLTAALPERLDTFTPAAALLEVIAPGCEEWCTDPWRWRPGFARDHLARAYYSLLQALGYEPSTVELDALARPASDPPAEEDSE